MRWPQELGLQLPASPDDIAREIDDRGLWLCLLRPHVWDDDAQAPTDAHTIAQVNRLTAEIDRLTQAYVTAYRNEIDR